MATNWPGMSNADLADILDRVEPREIPTDYQISAIEEAAERIRERGDDDD